MQAAKLISLPLPERMHAMEVLWSSLTQDSQAHEIAPEWHKKTVLARVKKLKAGEETTLSLEQTRKSIQKRIKAILR